MSHPMNSQASDQASSEAAFPRLPLITAAALVVFAVTIVAIAQINKLGAARPADPGASIVAERDLRFEDQADGGIAIIDTRSGSLIDTVAPGTNGFLRGALRGMARERKREDFDRSTPFQLSQTQAGHLVLKDPTTGRFIDLGSFGPTNAAVFANLLTARPGVASNRAASANPS
jgi:putative photosynthetic complex assembly protein